MGTLYYSIPYLFVGVILFVLYLNEKGDIHYLTQNVSRRIAWVIVFVFIGLRGHMYSDFISYYPFYEELPDIFHIKDIFTSYLYEPGFIIYSSLVKVFAPNYFAWVAINTLIDLVVLHAFFKRYTTSVILPLIFFLAFQGISIEFNLYRNVKAIDLFLLSIPFLQQRRFLPYLALNLLGVTFHTSSLLYLPMYFVLHKQLPKSVMWGGIICANLLYFGHITFISNLINNVGFIQDLSFYDKLAGYEARDAEYGFSIGYFERTCAILIFTCLYNRLITQNRANILFYNCFYIYYCSFLIFNEVQVFVERVPLLFVFSYWVLYPNVIAIKNKWRQVVVALAALFVITKLASSGASHTYENILFHYTDYDTRADQMINIMEDNKK